MTFVPFLLRGIDAWVFAAWRLCVSYDDSDDSQGKRRKPPGRGGYPGYPHERAF
jgi:hypothetical protein